jgi:hypothetical protein
MPLDPTMTFYVLVEGTLPQFPFLSKMARQFLTAPSSSRGAERLFFGIGKMHDDLKKSTDDMPFESQLLISMTFPNA